MKIMKNKLATETWKNWTERNTLVFRLRAPILGRRGLNIPRSGRGFGVWGYSGFQETRRHISFDTIVSFKLNNTPFYILFSLFIMNGSNQSHHPITEVQGYSGSVKVSSILALKTKKPEPGKRYTDLHLVYLWQLPWEPAAIEINAYNNKYSRWYEVHPDWD